MNSDPQLQIVVLSDRDKLSLDAAERFVGLAGAAIAGRGRFAVALSGGSTPRDLYRQLASDAFRPRVDWSRVDFFWGDERAVPPDSPDSNYRMADETLLSRVPVPASNIYRIRAEKGAEGAAEEYDAELIRYFSTPLPRFDLILLGLGTNGHTASLFPGTPVLNEKERRCASVWVPELDSFRITLTVPVLNNAADDLFIVAGTNKAETVRQVLQGPFEPERLPAQLVRPIAGQLLYLLDSAAASRLQLTRNHHAAHR